MKKLIEELERKSQAMAVNSLISDGQCYGFNLALQIVRSHNPWTSVEELPPLRDGRNDVTIVVLLDNGQSVSTAYYDYKDGYWWSAFQIVVNPKRWAYLPEVQP